METLSPKTLKEGIKIFSTEDLQKMIDYNKDKGTLEKKVKADEKVKAEEEETMTDSEIAEAVLEENKKFIINNNGILYAYYKNVWSTDINSIFTQWLGRTELVINKNGKKIKKVKDQTKYWTHYRQQMEVKCKENLEPINILNKEINILPFLDGVYDMKEKVFKSYEEHGICYLTYCVNRKFPKNTSKIMEIKNIMMEIFDDNEELLKECFSFWARGLGKNVRDKVGLLLVGERSSGKGVIVGLFEKAFRGVIGNILSGGLSSKFSLESAERKNGFLEPMCDNVLCFSQEIDPKNKFDGAIWRTLVSGGDEISYRVSYGRLQTKSIIALATFTANVIISFDQNNSSDTLLVCDMPCQFRDTVPTDNINRGYKVKLCFMSKNRSATKKC